MSKIYGVYGCNQTLQISPKHLFNINNLYNKYSSSRVNSIVWMLTKHIEKNLTGIAQEGYELYWTNPGSLVPWKKKKQPPKTKQLYVHLQPISKTIKIRQSRHAGHCWRSKYELISDVLLWKTSHGRVIVGRQQLCTDTGCSLEDLLGATNDRNEWRERERESHGNQCKQRDLIMRII